MAKLNLNLGSLVELKSGGPIMTVKSLQASNGRYICQWFAGKKLEQGEFPAESLQAATLPPEAK
jgi:uncharacterized protein YodC (DUF2158 family)